MLLGVIPMFFFFRFWGFLEKIAKRRKIGKSGENRAPMSQRREPTLRRRLKPRRGIPSPRRG